MLDRRSMSLFAVAASCVLTGVASADDTVKLPLSTWTKVQAELAAARARDGEDAGRPVVVGSTVYRGRSDGRNLHLRLRLAARLASGSVYKTVEVVGADAVIVSASEGGRSIALTWAGAYWVWQTTASGPVELDVELIVPPRGPRGSIEYRFGVVESPVTELVAHFPVAGLSPEVTGAVTSSVRASAGGTELSTLLRPTRQIELVGFRDLDSGDARRPAKLYGETETLVSLADTGVEIFSVVGLTILEAPAKRFRVALPRGFELVSADGEGAFQHTLETEGDETVLVGETALPIKSRYEISLRLKRRLAADERELLLPIPRLLGVERDAGFVALEVPGKLSVEGVEGRGLVGLDVRDLPATLLRSSVSPIARAYRYTGQRDAARIAIGRHPEIPLAVGGVDVLRATSVITEQGRVMTELAFTIRNHLQQYLVLELDRADAVRSAVLDGEPIKPSLDDAGRTLVPLRRSTSGDSGLVPFRVQLVYESSIPELGAIGRRSLVLPRLLVPVAAIDWSVYVPGTYAASRLAGPVGSETFVKNARFHHGSDGEVAFEDGDDGEGDPFGDESGSAGEPTDLGLDADDDEEAVEAAPPARREERASGSMPVRVQLPRDGHRLVHQRFWIGPREVVTAELDYARTPAPLVLGAALFLGFALLGASALRVRSRLAIASTVALGAALLAASGATALLAGLVAASGLALARLGAGRLRARARALAGSVVEAAGALVRAARASLELRAASSRRGALAPALAVTWVLAKLALLTLLGGLLLAEAALLLAVLRNPL